MVHASLNFEFKVKNVRKKLMESFLGAKWIDRSVVENIIKAL